MGGRVGQGGEGGGTWGLGGCDKVNEFSDLIRPKTFEHLN